MNERPFISRFTPSRTDVRDLEAIFVQRQALLEDTARRIADSASSRNRQHFLFVAPRGQGKTHFITLLFYRLHQDEALRPSLRIAWLNEDETCTRVLDLLLRIWDALSQRYPAEFSHLDDGELAELHRRGETAATDWLADRLERQLGDRCLLVLTENLDATFDAIKEDGQKQLRALLQNHPIFCLAATAQGLVKGISDREAPFFGFFQIEHLQPLSVNEAIELLRNIAKLKGDTDLADYLDEPAGRSRVRALHHLSGGNHRIYIVLSELITRDTLDQLVRPFDQMVDELTPYYQERIRSLSPLQARIVQHLCRHSKPCAVKQIATQLVTSPQSVASQLKILRDLGYVQGHRRGRETLYELCEPLMRLIVEVKENHRREPLRLLIDFLRAWYDRPQLEDHQRKLPTASIERLCVTRALEALQSEPVPLRLQLLLDDLLEDDASKTDESEIMHEVESLALAAIQGASSKPPTHAIDVLTRLLDSGRLSARFCDRIYAMRGLLRASFGNDADAHNDFTAALTSGRLPSGLRAMLLVMRGRALRREGRQADALQDLREALNRSDELPDEFRTEALLKCAHLHAELGQHKEAIRDASTALETSSLDEWERASALSYRARALAETDQRTRAIRDWDSLLALDSIPARLRASAHVLRGFSRQETGDELGALTDFGTYLAFECDEWAEQRKEVLTWLRLYAPTIQDSRPEDAVKYLSEFIEHAEGRNDKVEAILNRALLGARMGNTSNALTDIADVLRSEHTEPHDAIRGRFLRGVVHCYRGDWDRGLEDVDSACAADGTVESADHHPLWLSDDVEELVTVPLLSGLAQTARSQRSREIAAIFDKHGLLERLGQGMIHSLRRLHTLGLDGRSLEAWGTCWHEAARDKEELTIPLRLFTTGIEYLKTEDPNVLLNLVDEERRVLANALRIEGPETDA